MTMVEHLLELSCPVLNCCPDKTLKKYLFRTSIHDFYIPYLHYMAYFLHFSLANWMYMSLFVLKILAISGTRGSSGLGSHSSEQMDRSTCKGQKT